MRWTQLKQRLEMRFSEKLKGRVEVFQTRYRHSHDQEAELWIMVDGERALSCGSLTYLTRLGTIAVQLNAQGLSWSKAYDIAFPIAAAEGDQMVDRLNRDLFDSLSMTNKEMLQHRNPIVRALGVLDRRTGTRRLMKLREAPEHEFVARMIELRRSLERGATRRAANQTAS